MMSAWQGTRKWLAAGLGGVVGVGVVVTAPVQAQLVEFNFSGTVDLISGYPEEHDPPWAGVSVGDPWSLLYYVDPGIPDGNPSSDVGSYSGALTYYVLTIGQGTVEGPADGVIVVYNNHATEDGYVAKIWLDVSQAEQQYELDLDLLDGDGSAWSSDALPLACDIDLEAFESRRFANVYEGNDHRFRLSVQGHSSGSCAKRPPGMVAWWSFDEASGTTAADIAGGNDGTHINAPTRAPGKVDIALDFDGINDYVEVPHDPSLNPGLGSFSIDAWIRSVAGPSLRDPIVEKQWVSLIDGGYALFLRDGRLFFSFWNSDPSGGDTTVDSGVFMNNGAWHHVAVTIERDSDALGNFYVDGAFVSSFSLAGSPGAWDNTNPLRIGGHPLAGAYFDGLIDEVEIFDRALSPSEVASIWDADCAGKCKKSKKKGIPTVSEWGAGVLTLLVLTGGTLVLTRRERVSRVAR